MRRVAEGHGLRVVSYTVSTVLHASFPYSTPSNRGRSNCLITASYSRQQSIQCRPGDTQTQTGKQIKRY